MGNISAIGGSVDAWASMRSHMQAHMFAKADSNGDGSVNKSELDSMLSEVGKATGQDLSSNLDKAFKRMDANGDAKLSSDELASGMQSLLPPPSTMDFAQGFNTSASRSSSGNSDGAGGNPLNAIFSKVDANGDGKLDSKELKSLAAQIKSDTGMDASGKLNQLAKDNGGTVTKDQLLASIEQSGPPVGMGGMSKMDGSSGTSATSDSSSSDTALQTLLDAIQKAARSNHTNHASGSSGSSGVSNDEFAKMVKSLYAQFASSMSQTSQRSLSTIA